MGGVRIDCRRLIRAAVSSRRLLHVGRSTGVNFVYTGRLKWSGVADLTIQG
jgi:hypothetical protein